MDEAWKKKGDETFVEMLEKGYIVKTDDGGYVVGEEPSLFEENDVLVKFWYHLKKILGQNGSFLAPKNYKSS